MNNISFRYFIFSTVLLLCRVSNANYLVPGWVSNGAKGQEFESPESTCKAVASNAGSEWSYASIAKIKDSTGYYCNLFNPNNYPQVGVYALVEQATCPTDPRWVTSYFSDGIRYCKMFNINISGPNVTNALPSKNGPITQSIKITSVDGVEKNVHVVLRTRIGQTVAGYTDDDGEVSFIVVPSDLVAAMIEISASCLHCENTASKTITVLPTDLNQLEEPQMCRR
ncbi:hypothetical protein [Comamonas odontotermitis]|uniref:hypothetical protein n=1 Tax=Comamonas odontotermitis TaxID=379895 RepID=UPI003751382D